MRRRTSQPTPAAPRRTTSKTSTSVRGQRFLTNVARAALGALIPRRHVRLMPRHAPLQLLSRQPAAGFSARNTGSYDVKDRVHVPFAHLIPAGELETVPFPVTVTRSWYVAGAKSALTLFVALRVSEQSASPLHPPDHLMKR